MYWGPVDDVVPYFASLGYQCPNYTNPADYVFMSILNTEKQAEMALKDTVNSDKVRITELLGKWSNCDLNQKLLAQVEVVPANKGYSKTAGKFHSDFLTQFQYLLGRAGRNALRNKFIIRVKFIQSMFIALLMGLIYLNLPSQTFNQQVQNFSGAIFFICVNMVMGSSIGILSIFSLEKSVFIREHTNGYYGLSAYFLSKTLVELPHQVILPIVQTIIIYFMVGLNGDPTVNFFVYALTLVLLTVCGSALGVFFASLFADLTVSLAVTPMVLLPLMLFSGLFVNNGSIPVYFDWIKYLSPIKYGFEILFKTQFDDQWKYAMPGSNVVVHGPDVVKQLGLDDGLTVPILLLILFSMYVGLLCLAFLALKRAVNKKKK